MNKIQTIPHHRFPAADGIRGLAVLIVLCAHALVMFLPSTRPYLAGTGKVGVWLFFVLSAFLLTNKFINNGVNAKSILEYAFGRFIRIIPMFCLASLFYFSVGYFDFQKLLKIITFQEGYGHLWTIPVEFKFYFALPFIVMFYQILYRLSGLAMICILTLIALAIARYIFPPELLPENSTYTRWYISSFLIGVLVSYLSQGHQGEHRKLGFVIVACLLSVLMIVPAVSSLVVGREILPNLSTSYLSLSIVWGMLIYFSFMDMGLFNRFFSGRIMRSIGNQSFSTYLFHWYVLTELSRIFSGNIAIMILSIASSLFIGRIVYYFFEKNIETARHLLLHKIISPSY